MLYQLSDCLLYNLGTKVNSWTEIERRIGVRYSGGVRFNGSYSTISSFHSITPIVGNSLNGSLDAFFYWNRIASLDRYEGVYLSSSGIRIDGMESLLVGAIYNLGHIDCGFAIMKDTKFQRPALS